MGEVLKKFGRYFLLDQIAQGGMAEICRARLASTDGAGRLMVIKRIQASFGTNPEFLQMFKSEIKTTMGFNHPNIVQLYDFGEEQGQPYIAMELVDGKNLRQFISRVNELKQPFPIPLAVFIVEQTASGLHYAHTYKDKISGEPLNIVHRDISPQNILISYEGNVKVIDFGIAKATTNLENTRAGVIKGKPSYLSPEQISGDVLDGRSDLFALGIVLWELLVGKKLFAGENELAVLKLIESCATHVKPPSTFNPKVPKELDAIVMKMLAKQADRRYQTADELQRALHRFLYVFSPDFNPSDLAYYAKDLFKDQIVDDRKKIQRLNEEVEQLLAVFELPRITRGFDSGPEPAGKKEETTTVVDARARSTGARALEIDPARNQKVLIDTSSSAQPGGGRPRGGYLKRENEQVPEPQPLQPAKPVRPIPLQPRPAAPIRQQPRRRGGGLMTAAIGGGIALLGALYFGVFKIPGWPPVSPPVTQTDNPTVAVNPPPDANRTPGNQSPAPVPAPTPASANTFPLRLSITPKGGKVTVSINGQPVNLNQSQIMVPINEALELKAERKNYKTITRQFVVDSQRVKDPRGYTTEDINFEPLRFGYFSIHSTPSAEAEFVVDGQKWTKSTPFDDLILPADDYTIKLTNQVLGMEKTIQVKIKENTKTNVDVRLEIKGN